MEIKYFDFFTFLFRNNFTFIEKLHYIFIVICDIINSFKKFLCHT